MRREYDRNSPVCLLACAFFLSAAAPNSANAQSIDGNTVFRQCVTNSDDLTSYGFCVGYIMGVWEGIKYGSAVMVVRTMPEMTVGDANALADQSLNVCVPPEVEAGQIVQIAIDYLSSRPAERHESARGLIYSAVSDAFPCG